MERFPKAAKKYLFSYAYSFSMGGEISGGGDRKQEKGLKGGGMVEERGITSGKGE